MDNITMKTRMDVFQKRPEKAYPVTEFDWNDLKKMINNIVPEERVYSILASIFGGIFASALFFLISFISNSSTSIPLWITITGWVVTSLSFSACVFFLLMHKQQGKLITISKELILEEMKRIEAKCIKPIDDET